jgi:hypothetical protein
MAINGVAADFSDHDAYSFSCWFKTDGATGGTAHEDIIFSMHTSSGYNVLRLGVDRLNDGIFYADTTTGNITLGSVDYNDEAWHHLVVTRAAGVGNQTLTAYVDGSSIGTNAASDPSFTSATQASLAQEWDSSTAGDFFAGFLDEPAIWDSALSSGDIALIWNNGTPTDLTSFAPLSWWRMGDSGTGSSAVLDVAGDNDGALYNNPSYELDVPSA